MDERQGRDNARMKGEGDSYYERAKELEKEMTPEEKAEEEAWWAQISQKFKVKGKE